MEDKIKKILEYIKNKINTSKSKDYEYRGLDFLFRSKEVFNADNNELFEALKELNTNAVVNENVRHREIIRTITIDSILNRRHIEALEDKNTQLSSLNMILSVAVIFLTVWGLFMSPQAIVAKNEVDNFKRQAIQFCESNPENTWPLIGGGETSCKKVLESKN